MTEQPVIPEPTTATQEPTKSSWFSALVRDPSRAWILLAALCIPAVAILVFALRGANPTAAVGTVLPTAAIVPLDPGPLMAQEATLQAAQTALRRYQYQMKDVADIHDHLQHEIEAWQNEIGPTLKSERGQFLAAQPDLVRRFSIVYRTPRFTQADLEAARARTRELSRPIDDALAGRGTLYNPDEDERRTLAAQIQEERELAQDALSAIRQARNSAVALLDHAKTIGEKAKTSLAEAIEQDEKSLAFDIAQKTASIQEQAKREAAEKEAAALAEQTRKLGEMRAEAIEAETNRKIKEQQEETERENRKAERERLEARAKSPEIQAKYQPFLAKSTIAVHRRFAHDTDTPRPNSYSNLQMAGALYDYKTFAKAGAGVYNDGTRVVVRNTGRPTWPLPTTDQQYLAYRPLFEEFKQLAPIWIQLGVLDP